MHIFFFLISFCALTVHAQEKTLEVTTKDFQIDSALPRMVGPSFLKELEKPFGSTAKVWLTGAEIVGFIDGKESSEAKAFLCHSAVSLKFSEQDKAVLVDEVKRNPRDTNRRHMHHGGGHDHAQTMDQLVDKKILFSLSVNQPQIRFPKGYALELSAVPLAFSVTVTNLIPEERTKRVSFKMRLYYMEDRPGLKLKALKMKNVVGSEDRSMHTTSPRSWILKEGERRTLTTDITDALNLNDDGPKSVVYIGSHMHPGVESAELQEVKSGKSIFKSDVSYTGEHMENMSSTFYSSSKPINFHPDSKYKVVVKSTNTYKHDVNLMSVFYLYYFEGERTL